MVEPQHLVTLTIDGRTVKAPAGTLVIEAAKGEGIEIPSFCYYPGFSLQAACRMCLVEIEKTPKLQTACTVPAAEGMVVRTDTEKVRQARKGTLEFLLTNHPLDCPVCDKGGECELQDMAFRYGAGSSRFREEKIHVNEKQWSPVVYYDAPRCILCFRCVRVCGEGLDVRALGVVNRGAVSEIAPNEGDHLNCEECGMCIDICPVGALTSGAYRHKARPWELRYVPTVCTHCGDGCKTTLSVRNNTVLRGNNRDTSGINGSFLCIKGRYAFDFLDHPGRLKQPLVRKDGRLEPASWAEAAGAVARRFAEIRRSGGKFGVIGSTRTTNEAAYCLQKFARVALGTNNIDHRRSADFPALMDALARQGGAGWRPLAASAHLLKAPAVLLVGNNPTDQHPLLAWNIRENVRLNGGRLYLINRAHIQLERQAVQSLLMARGQEAAVLDFLAGQEAAPGSLGPAPQAPGQAGTPGPMAEAWSRFREALRQEKDVVVVFGTEIKGENVGRLVRLGDTLSGTTRYIALTDHNNSRGASDMGLLPSLLPGYAAVDEAAARAPFERRWNASLPAAPGLAMDEIMREAATGMLEALYVVGANPANRYPIEAGRTFLVAQDLFLTETAAQADVVLPAASAYENDGTVTNTCGEVQRLKKALLVNGPKTDLDILGLLAREMGLAELVPRSMEEVFAEIRQLVKGYDLPVAPLLIGNAVPTLPLEGRVPHDGREDLIRSSNDTLFTSGTLGRYSSVLGSVTEKDLRKNPQIIGK
jgi:NADH-quinone oxidoreductase subunit G